MLHSIHVLLQDIRFWHGLNIFSAAGLGSSFYVMIKIQPYLVTRSYDPKYNAVYTSRFIVGLIGGVILEAFFGDWLSGLVGKAASFTPGAFALLGGYASEAVEQILQRIVEILLAAVHGDGSADAQTKAAQQQARKNTAVSDLLPALEAAQTDPAKFKDALQKIRDVLVKNSA